MEQEYLKLRKSNCKNCYKCIRNCPVKSIKFLDDQAYILEQDCILCGNCFVNCPQNAKVIRYDLNQVKSLIASGKKVIVSLAPSFIANFEGYNFSSIEKALLKLGFYSVEETAIGATIVKTEYERILKEEKPDVLISSCCSSINLLIQKHFPEVLPYLANVISPMVAHCQKIKQENPDCYTVFIGPCISKKYEGDHSKGIVDYVLTFEELSTWFDDVSMELEHVVDESKGGRARLFPTTGGVIKTMDTSNKEYHYISVDGLDNCITILNELKEKNIHNCFIEMSSCKFSCSGGPCIAKEKYNPLYDLVKICDYAKEEDFEVTNNISLNKKYENLSMTKLIPSEEKIREILASIGKKTKEQELNCGSCGYPTCRDKAIAVYQGKADLNMCLPFLKEKAQSFADTIIDHTPNGVLVMNYNLDVQLINRSAMNILNIKNREMAVGKNVSLFIDPYLYVKSLVNDYNIIDYSTYYEGIDKHVRQSVIHDRDYQLVIVIMKDISDIEKALERKEQLDKKTIETANKVIEKQMRIAQEIASLLGETTAETKIALTKLKESLTHEE